jgi:hypothetical protein
MDRPALSPVPRQPATISGTITAADVTNLANERGISAGEFDELLAAIRAGATYVNVHSTGGPAAKFAARSTATAATKKH